VPLSLSKLQFDRMVATAGKATSKYTTTWQKTDIIHPPSRIRRLQSLFPADFPNATLSYQSNRLGVAISRQMDCGR
jgi:hypothetical protein